MDGLFLTSSVYRLSYILQFCTKKNYIYKYTKARELTYLSTGSPIASKLYLQCLHHFELQGGLFQMQEEPPKVAALRQSWLAFPANHP